MANELKAQGNKAFQSGEFEEAIKYFTQAIEIDGSNHVLYSNRSASQASLQNYSAALEDALQCVQLNPNWGKGYSRLGTAYQGLKNFDKALEAYDQGLEKDPDNQQLIDGKMEAQSSSRRARRGGGAGGMGGPDGGLGGFFNNPEVIQRLMQNPKTRGLLQDPETLSMISQIQKDPSKMTQFLGNPKFQAAFQVALGLQDMDIPGAAAASQNAGPEEAEDQNMFEDDKEQDSTQQNVKQDEDQEEKVSPPKKEPAFNPLSSDPRSSKASSTQQTPKSYEKKEEPKEEVPPQPSLGGQEKEAQAEKEKGNAAYKQKKFEDALTHYTKAIELDDKDISFITNRAAVYFEMGEFEKCIKDCEEAWEKGRELRADYKLVARALSRKGTALVKLNKLEDAIYTYNKSLTEHRNADTLKRLNDTEKLLKDRQALEYQSIDISNEEKDKGNQAFKEQKYPEAIKFYTEALKRGPPQINPEAHKLYSNRAACFTKLGAWNDGLKDADTCIELKPDFIKGYSRKGHLQFFMKEYEKALETYEAGLKFEPGNAELTEGASRCRESLAKFMTGSADESELNERRQRALQDPEIQNILKDPIVNQVLMDLQSNPKQAQKHFTNPVISQKLQKLMSSGIIQMK